MTYNDADWPIACAHTRKQTNKHDVNFNFTLYEKIQKRKKQTLEPDGVVY